MNEITQLLIETITSGVYKEYAYRDRSISIAHDILDDLTKKKDLDYIKRHINFLFKNYKDEKSLNNYTQKVLDSQISNYLKQDYALNSDQIEINDYIKNNKEIVKNFINEFYLNSSESSQEDNETIDDLKALLNKADSLNIQVDSSLKNAIEQETSDMSEGVKDLLTKYKNEIISTLLKIILATMSLTAFIKESHAATLVKTFSDNNSFSAVFKIKPNEINSILNRLDFDNFQAVINTNQNWKLVIEDNLKSDKLSCALGLADGSYISPCTLDREAINNKSLKNFLFQNDNNLNNIETKTNIFKKKQDKAIKDFNTKMDTETDDFFKDVKDF